MSATVFTNVRIFDGSGSLPEPGEVRVEGDRIASIVLGGANVSREDARIVDGKGGVLMPGLVDAHTHLGLGSSVEMMGRPGDFPDAESALTMAHCGRVMLDYGFTSGYSAGCFAVKAEKAVQKAFDSGLAPGPRLRTSSFERVPGGPMGLKVSFPGKDVRVPDPAALVAFVEEMAAIGVDSVKFLLNGVSAFHPGSNMGEQFYDEEIFAAAEAAHKHKVALTAHCYTAHAVQLAIKAGFRMLYHCTYADDAALDAMVEAKDRIFVGPAPGIVEADLIRGPKFGIMASPAQIEEQTDAAERIKRVGAQLKARGIRSIPGGDYGFPWNPVGMNARDIELFVEWFGYTPAEALSAATMLGGLAMDFPGGVGQIKPGFLADVLVVDGDPTRDISLLRNPASFSVIMRGGKFHKGGASA